MVFSVTSSILYKIVGQFCPVEHLPATYHDQYLLNTQIWSPEMAPQDHFVYLIGPEDLRKNRRRFRHCLLICAGAYDAEAWPFHPSNDLILCPELSDTDSLANIVFTIFYQFRTWRNVLNNILLTTESFHEILMASRALLNMEFFLFNSNYEILAVTDQFFHRFVIDSPAALITDLEQDEDGILSSHFADRDLYEWPLEDDRYCLYAYNIFFHENHTATLLARCPKTEYMIGDRQFLEYFGSMITDYYASYYTRIHHTETENQLVQLLSAFASNDLSATKNISDILYSYGWLTYHSYLVIEFSFMRQKELTFSGEYFCSQIENLFGSCIAFTKDDIVYCVINTSLTKEEEVLKQLPYFLRDNLCYAGISNPCTNITTLHSYFTQARQALFLGRQANPDFWYFRFSDYTFQYIMMQNSREYEASQIVHPALGLLKEHDRKNQTDYYHTLQVYLENNMNASRTAQQLFIHRSTFLQRLAQIEKLTKIRLDDSRERTYLQLSFIMENP